ncbi:MAG: CatB-related O-acetyltransferase, partial [Pseudomonadota bacterium]
GEGSSLEIGSFCSIAENVQIFLGGNHRVDWGTTFPFGHVFEQKLGSKKTPGHPSTKGNVVIGNDVWLGSGATIMSGISVGHGAVVAANSTVVKDIDAYEIWGGNPAQLISKRFDGGLIQRLLELAWWTLSESEIKEISPLLSQPMTHEVLDKIYANLST